MATTYWNASDLTIAYTVGSHEPIIGETLTGVISGATAEVVNYTVTSGAWGTSDAAGILYLSDQVGTFEAETIQDSDTNVVCTIATDTATNDGDWSLALNWTNGVPGQDDTAIFDSRSSTSVTAGIGDANRASTGGAANAMALLHVKEAFTGDIGTLTDYLLIGDDVATGLHPIKIVFEGLGILYVKASAADQVTNSEIGKIIINSDKTTGTGLAGVYVASDVNSGSFYSRIASVDVARGNLTVIDDSYLVELNMAPKLSRQAEAGCTIGKGVGYVLGGTKSIVLRQDDGSLVTDSGMVSVEMHGGTFTFGTDGAAITDADIEIMRMYGGSFLWNPDDTGNDAYIGELWLYGGALDATSSVNVEINRVLGDSGKDIHVFGASSLFINNGRGNITVDASSNLFNFGGTITTDSYSQLDVNYDQA